MDSLTGKVNASYTLKLDANGRVVGWKFNNDGSTGSFIVVADKFAVVDPSGGNSLLAYSNGNLSVSGVVTSTLITASAMKMGSTRILTDAGTLAPFVIRDTTTYNGGTGYGNRTVQLDNFLSPSQGSGYDWKRFADYRMDVFIDCIATCDAPSDGQQETVILEVNYDGTGWMQITSVTSNASYKSAIPVCIRYTTPDPWWGTCSFRARTTQGHTVSLSLTVTVLNFNTSGNSPNTNSGISGGTGSPPPANGGGSGGTFCPSVDAIVIRVIGGLDVPTRAGDIKIGDYLRLTDGSAGRVSRSECQVQSRVRVIGERGTHLTCSVSAPLELAAPTNCNSIAASASIGAMLRAYAGPERVITVEDVGAGEVQSISCESAFFWAGDEEGAYLGHHNIKPQP